MNPSPTHGAIKVARDGLKMNAPQLKSSCPRSSNNTAGQVVGRASRRPLIEALPDETLFSLCSRHHRLWGYGSSSSSCRALFGSRRAGVQHDFPNALGGFERLTDGAFGSASALALHQTILKFYAPFSQPIEIGRAMADMAGPSVAHLKFRMGLLTSRFRAHHPLKACEWCIAEDVHDHGWVYWHLEHQFPGVWTCRRHGLPLQECTVKANGVERFMWHLPMAERLQPVDLAHQEVQDRHRRLSDLVTELVSMDRPFGWLHASATQVTLRARLQERGWLTQHGRLHSAAASRDFGAHLETLNGLPELARLNVSDELARTWFERIARPLRSGTHPLRLLLAIHWLFESAEDFIECHDRITITDVAVDPDPSHERFEHKAPALGYRKNEATRLLQAGDSARSVALALGVDVGTVMAWGAQNGISPRPRPKSLVSPIREALIAALKTGQSKKEAAAIQGVTLQSITRLLRTEPGLHAAWRAAAIRQMQRERREVWQRIVRTHPDIGIKLLRAMSPATYSWLYRNDREWLRQHSPSPAERSARRPSIRWDDRDVALSSAVRHAALQFHAIGRTKPIRLWEIVQQIPELKAKLGALRRLPLTAHALEEVLGRPTRRSSTGLVG